MLVAGLPCVGKSTLIRRLQGGELPALAGRLGLGDGSGWTFRHADQLIDVEGRFEKLLVHYDLLRILRRKKDRYADDRVLNALLEASEIVLVTLWEPPPVLRQRLGRRLRENALNALVPFLRRVPFRKISHQWKVRRQYRSAEWMAERYGEWFAFCGGRGNGSGNARSRRAPAHWLMQSGQADAVPLKEGRENLFAHHTDPTAAPKAVFQGET